MWCAEVKRALLQRVARVGPSPVMAVSAREERDEGDAVSAAGAWGVAGQRLWLVPKCRGATIPLVEEVLRRCARKTATVRGGGDVDAAAEEDARGGQGAAAPLALGEGGLGEGRRLGASVEGAAASRGAAAASSPQALRLNSLHCLQGQSPDTWDEERAWAGVPGEAGDVCVDNRSTVSTDGRGARAPDGFAGLFASSGPREAVSAGVHATEEDLNASADQTIMTRGLGSRSSHGDVEPCRPFFVPRYGARAMPPRASSKPSQRSGSVVAETDAAVLGRAKLRRSRLRPSAMADAHEACRSDTALLHARQLWAQC